MPIFAAPAVSETSVNTGAAAGNALPTVTVLLVPFTEIVALVAVPGTGVDPCAIRSDGCLFGFGFAVETGFDEAGVEAGAQPLAQSASCWWNGSLLLNLLNETSWPAFGGNGLLGSE